MGQLRAASPPGPIWRCALGSLCLSIRHQSQASGLGGDDALGAATGLALSQFCLCFCTFLGCSGWSLPLGCSDVHPGAGLGSGGIREASQALAACLASQNPGSVCRCCFWVGGNPSPLLPQPRCGDISALVSASRDQMGEDTWAARNE